MTDEIIEAARQAGFSIADGVVTGGITDLERFSEMVENAAFTRWVLQTKLAVQDEREACARVCDQKAETWAKEGMRPNYGYGQAIRTRSKK